MVPLPEGVVRIPLPTPLPVGEVNAYLLMGQVPTLVDPGPCTSEALTVLQEGLRQVGIQMGDLWQIIITHPHVDHLGLASAVAAKSGARILAHRQAVNLLADPVGSVHHTVRFLRNWGERQGIPSDSLSQLAWGYIRWAGLAEPAEVHEVLEDGETVMAGNDFWRVLYTPGHSSGHICLYREMDGTLISGDHLLPKTVSSTLIEPAGGSLSERIRSGPDYLAALSQLALLQIGTVLPGHGEHFQGATPEFLVSRIEAVRNRAEQAYRLLTEEPSTLWQLCRAIFPQVGPDLMIFALSNTAGYLDLLSAYGRIAEVNHDKLTRFVALEAAMALRA